MHMLSRVASFIGVGAFLWIGGTWGKAHAGTTIKSKKQKRVCGWGKRCYRKKQCVYRSGPEQCTQRKVCSLTRDCPKCNQYTLCKIIQTCSRRKVCFWKTHCARRKVCRRYRKRRKKQSMLRYVGNR